MCFLTTRNIHGVVPPSLPEGYALQILPGNIHVSSTSTDAKLKTTTSCNVIRSFIASVPLFVLCSNFYINSSQLNKYGYAAYGLTVIAYSIMSTVSLIANILVPTYASLYIVRSEVMDEAEKRAGKKLFDDTVGTIIIDDDNVDLQSQTNESGTGQGTPLSCFTDKLQGFPTSQKIMIYLKITTIGSSAYQPSVDSSKFPLPNPPKFCAYPWWYCF